MAPLSQAESSQRMYGARAEKYEDSWHPQYSARFVDVVDPQPGQRILDLCCGTGLDLFLLAEALNKGGHADDGGLVVGVDTTAEMLAVAEQRQNAEPDLGRRIRLLQHDVTRLDTLPATETTDDKGLPPVREDSFDAIVCSSAFVLFEDPDAVVKSWRRYLKPPAPVTGHQQGSGGHGLHHHGKGGVLIVDIPHETNQYSSLIMERVARRLGVAWPSNRSWVLSINSFREVLERNGFEVERIAELDRISGRGPSHYTLADVDALYNSISKSEAFDAMVAGADTGVDRADIEKRGRAIFEEEFARDAGEGGRITVADDIYVYVARRTVK